MLMAQAFDNRALELAGEPLPVAGTVAAYGNVGAIFSASTNGIVAYAPASMAADNQLVWHDRHGKVLRSVGPPGDYADLALSPDGARVAVLRRSDASFRDIWVLELARGSSTRLTFGPAFVEAPVWSPDGSQIVFQVLGVLRRGIFRKSADGAGEEQALFKADDQSIAAYMPMDWSRDGRFLLYATTGRGIVGRSAPGAKGDWDLWIWPMQGPEGEARKQIPFLTTAANENSARFSPDGRWVVYTSDESGRTEVYVRPSPSSGGSGRWVISTAGGFQPLWRRDGKEILYMTPENKAMSVEVSSTAAFKTGVPNALFAAPIAGGVGFGGHYWDVSPDGQSFLINTASGRNNSPPITVIMNWTSDLKK
jgi:dipeptidyl aminopeptidase/acylaminoacyl peptidase